MIPNRRSVHANIGIDFAALTFGSGRVEVGIGQSIRTLWPWLLVVAYGAGLDWVAGLKARVSIPLKCKASVSSTLHPA